MADQVATVVLVAHGSRLESANEAHRRLARSLAQRVERPVLPAFLEMAAPSIADAIDAAAQGASRVVVVPYFLLPGNHTTRDIPELVDEARTRHPTVEIELTEHTGAEPVMMDVLSGQITRGSS